MQLISSIMPKIGCILVLPFGKIGTILNRDLLVHRIALNVHLRPCFSGKAKVDYKQSANGREFPADCLFLNRIVF